MSDTLDSIISGESAAPESSPVGNAGRERKAVTSGGSAVSLQVNDSLEAIYRGSSDVAGKFGVSKLYKFELIAPAVLTVVSVDKDTKVKSEERKTLDTGTTITTFGKGNFGYLIGSIVEGQDIEIRRVEDGTLPATHKFAGTKVHTYELFA